MVSDVSTTRAAGDLFSDSACTMPLGNAAIAPNESLLTFYFRGASPGPLTLDASAQLTSDVCIVGAGPAGIALALDLDAAGARVVILAGLEGEGEGEVDGAPYPPLPSTRAAGFGGTAALWDAELAPGTLGARYAPLPALARPVQKRA